MGCSLYSVVSSLHGHNLLLMDFLNTEKGAFEQVYQEHKASFQDWGSDLVEDTLAGILDQSRLCWTEQSQLHHTALLHLMYCLKKYGKHVLQCKKS